jgi:antitoxin component of RelBE/YafQ-DinJ toxin-antitoxin module
MKSSESITISLKAEVKKALKDGAQRMGLSPSGYVAYLVMQKRIEAEAVSFVAKLTQEQVQKALEDNK